MVNTGQPSEGCFKCRDRRVKCDATKPNCMKCQRLGVTCPGYPDRTANVAFRDETSRTRNRAARMYQTLRQREDRSRASQASSSDSSSSDSRELQTRPGPLPIAFQTGIIEPLGDSFDIRDVSFFKNELLVGTVSAYLASWSKAGLGLFEANIKAANNLYPDCLNCLKGALETMALYEMSLSDVANKHNIGKAAMDAYGRTLKELSNAIKSHEESEIEQILLAVELICFFEIFTATDDLPTRIYYHWSGMCAMITHLGSAIFRTEAKRRLFLDCFIAVVIGRMVMDRPRRIPLPPNAAETLVNSPLTPQIPEYMMLPILQKNFNLRISGADILDDNNAITTAEVVIALKSKAEDVLHQLKEWYAELPEERKHANKGMGTMSVNIGRVHQIFAYDLITRCIGRLRDLNASNAALEEEIRAARSQVKDLVMSVQACLPYTFIDDDPTPAESKDKGLSENMVEHLSYSHPLLVCSMVSFLEPAHHDAIDNARWACANGARLKKPARAFPRSLMTVAPLEPIATA